MLKITLTKSGKYLLELLNIVKGDKINNDKYKSMKKVEIKWLKF